MIFEPVLLTILLWTTTTFSGTNPPRWPPSSSKYWRETVSGFEATHHLLTNHCVDVDDEAVCTAYF